MADRENLTELNDSMTGIFAVRTEMSTYLLDLTGHVGERTFIRVASDSVDASELRRDGETYRLIRIVDCRVGETMTLLIDLRIPGVPFTLRRSTPVVSVRGLAGAF